MAPRVLIVVPARGGSKGLPRKNIKLLGGKPLIAWTAEAVHAAALPGALAILSTDDEEIAEAGRRCGLAVPFMRPAEFATDEATAEAVALHAIDWVRRNEGVAPEAVMLLQPTSPFRPASAIVEADALLAGERAAEGVVGVKPIQRTLRTLFHMRAGRLEPLGEQADLRSRRQEVEPLYTPNGAMYLVRAAALEARKGFFPPVARALVMDAVASIDIDTEDDWRIAEAIAARRG